MQSIFLAINFIILIITPPPCFSLTLPKIFSDGMVLQAAPNLANVWGFLDGNSSPVNVHLDCGDKLKQEKQTYVPTLTEIMDLDIFRFQFVVPQDSVCSLSFEQGDIVLNLTNVHFGDVWICSGQSNMEWRFGNIFNSADEMAQIMEYPNIKLFKLEHMTSSKPQEDLMTVNYYKTWVSSSDEVGVSSFSAICLLTAKYMADVLGKDKTFGLIETNWGGTRIEAWMTPEGLEYCGIDPHHVDDQNPQNSWSYLYNAMIHPLRRLSIVGALWYQGEANANGNMEEYGCAFPELINEWRRVWSMNSDTYSNFPFGFVQLAQVAPEQNSGFPMIRWFQTNGTGYVPNENMQNVFMAVSLDTYDAESQLHPRNKQLPSKRLATAGLNVAYGLDQFPTNGPFPTLIDFTLLSEGIQVDILYDQSFTWDPSETSGFYMCMQSECDWRGWQKVPKERVTAKPPSLSMILDYPSTALAYLWETTPVLGTEALPIYANNEHKLPAAPWWTPIEYQP